MADNLSDGYYDGIAEGYDSLHMAEQLQKMTEIIAAMGPDIPKKKETLLDVGCGTGISTSVWVCDCTGIDPSPELIKKAQQKFAGQQNKRFMVGNAEELPFPDKSFDVVISITAIHNFSDVKKGIIEMKRVGKDRFVFSVLRKAKQIEDIQKYIMISFRVKRIIMEEKDLIFICERRD